MHVQQQLKKHLYSDVKFCRYDSRYVKIRFQFP